MSEAKTEQKTIDDFLRQLQMEHQSGRVLAEYYKALRGLSQMTGKQEAVPTRETLEQWKADQEKQGLAPGTITNRIVRINAYLRYLGYEELCFPKGGRLDLAGRQFGNLTVIEKTGKISADRSCYWKCRCNLCGKEKEIPANQLIKGVQVSCGCGKEKRLQETNGYIDGTCLKRVMSDKISSNNTSGCKGVFQKRGKWAAQIQYKKKTYYLGSYDRFEDAVEARKRAEEWVREDAERLMEEFKNS